MRLYNAICEVLEAWAESIGQDEEKSIPEKGLTDTFADVWATNQHEPGEMNQHENRNWEDDPEESKKRRTMGFTQNNTRSTK